MSSLTDEIDLTDLEKGLYGLFRHIFIKNCHLDQASVTEEELSTLEELDSLEVLENLKDLSLELLKFKEDNIQSDVAELAEKANQFETMLQKLEGEVREHIRIEHQLRLHNDSTQSKLEEAEKELLKSQRKASELQEKLDQASVKNNKNFEAKLHTQIEKVSKKYKENPLRQEIENKITDTLEKKQIHVKKLEEENFNLKIMIDERNREIEMLRNNRHKTRAVENIRKKVPERTTDASRKQKLGKRPKHSRKPSAVNEHRNSPVLFAKRGQCASRQHVRSFSDYTKPNYSKRAPSR